MHHAAKAPRIDLIYDRDCSNIDAARLRIRDAMSRADVGISWHEWDRADANTPLELRNYGSPTVLVNGRDVACADNESAQSDANSCRIYLDACGCVCGAPSAELIVQALTGITTIVSLRRETPGAIATQAAERRYVVDAEAPDE